MRPFICFSPRLLHAAGSYVVPLSLTAALGCSAGANGPTPGSSVGATPGAVCNASNDENAKVLSSVTIKTSDASFSPMANGVLTDTPSVAAPVVSLASNGKRIELKRVVFVSPNEMRASIGADEKIPAGTYDVVIANPNGNVGTTAGVMKIVDPPVVSALAVPTAGSHTVCNAIDSTVTVSGTGFRPADGEIVEVLDAAGAVAFTGTAKDIKGDSFTMLLPGASPGTLAAGTYGIRVTGKEGPTACTGTKQGVLEVVLPPTVTTVAPISTCTEVGSGFVITGTGFREGVAVSFGGVTPTRTTRKSDTQIEVAFDAKVLGVGPKEVVVTNPELGDGGAKCRAAAPSKIDVYPPPAIGKVTDVTACTSVGTTFKIDGTGFRPGSTVTFGGVTASKTTIGSDTQIEVSFDATALPLGPADVVVTIPEKCTSTAPKAVNVFPPPVVTSAAPLAVCSATTSSFKIIGANFRPGSSVSFGGVAPLKTTYVSPTEVDVTFDAATLPPGTPDVTLMLPERCASTLPRGVTVYAPPTILTAAPLATCTDVSSTFRVMGTNFRPGSTVAFGGLTPAKTSFVSDTEIDVTFASKSLPQGATDVVVTTPEACFASAPKKVTVFGAPSISRINPTLVCTGGGAVVSVQGSGFRPGVTVLLGSTPAANVTVTSDTTLTFQAPPLLTSGSPYDVTVQIPEGCFGTLQKAYAVLAGPRVDSVDAPRGWNGIDNPIQINGDGFDRGSVVSLKGAAAGGGDLVLTDVVITPQTIRATVPAGGAVGGPYDLALVPPSGCGSVLPKAFTIDGAPGLTVSRVVPPFAWVGDKTPITILGNGFQSTPRAFLSIPGASPKMTPLKSTAFVSAQGLTSIVPANLAVGGPYDLVVINPDGGGGKEDAAFRVVARPLPAIASVSPAAGVVGGATAVTVTGCNFRNPAVSLVDSTGVVLAQSVGSLSCAGPATCAGGTNVCTMQATLTAPNNGAYLVRVTNPDDSTYIDYSAFVATNPSSKLETGFVTAEPLLVGRRSLATVSGAINSASRFIYAIGGEQADGTTLGTTEVSTLDLFGSLGKWYTQRNAFRSPRAGHAVVQLGGYVYAIGGTSTANGTGGTTPTGAALDTVERAKILDLTDVPQVDDPTISTTGVLDKGSWYYTIAAVKDAATDLDNPGGETLPSDEAVVTLGFAGSVRLSWKPVAGAQKYVIYRSPKVNGQSQGETFLAETTSLGFTDTGSTATDPSRTPLRRGSTGVWVTMAGRLARARFNAAATIAPDQTGQLRVYVIGGHGACVEGPSVTMDCWEMATLSGDGRSLGAWTAGASRMSVARERLGTGAMTSSNGGYSGLQAFVFASGGLGPSGSAPSIEYALVDVGGTLTWKGVPGAQYSPKARDGASLGIANGAGFTFGGGAPGAYTGSIKRSGAATVGASTVAFGSWSDAVTTIPAPVRGRFGFTLESAYFYLVGGTSNDADALTSVVQVIY